MTLASYAAVCAVTAYVCTCVKEDGTGPVATASVRLFAFLAFGIAAFAAVIQVFTRLAG